MAQLLAGDSSVQPNAVMEDFAVFQNRYSANQVRGAQLAQSHSGLLLRISARSITANRGPTHAVIRCQPARQWTRRVR